MELHTIIRVLFVALVIAPCVAVAQADLGASQREVRDNRIVSTADPAVEISVPTPAGYLGTRRIVIDGRFDAELHVFAEADDFGLIERFYWVQFERYLPDAPGRYDYRQSNPETVRIDGIEMHVQPGGGNTVQETVRPGSDYAAFRDLVDAAGLRLPTWITTLRLVQLYGPTERHELMVIYGEGPDALAEAATEAMIAGERGLDFEDLLVDLLADVDRRIDIAPHEEG